MAGEVAEGVARDPVATMIWVGLPAPGNDEYPWSANLWYNSSINTQLIKPDPQVVLKNESKLVIFEGGILGLMKLYAACAHAEQPAVLSKAELPITDSKEETKLERVKLMPRVD